jgi:cytochrome P450
MSSAPRTGRRRAIATALVIAGLLALLASAYVGYRLYEQVRSHPPVPREPDVSQVAPWMTVRYVAHLFGVPEPELYRALDADPDWARDLSLEQVATRQGQSVDVVLARVRATISQHRAARPPPGVAPPP